MPLIETRNWFAYYLKATGGADITNQFIVFGVAAGIGAIFLAIYLFAGAFSELGKTMKSLRKNHASTVVEERLLWSFGVVLGVHLINWLGISYFDQFLLIWCLHLAAIAALVQSVRAKASDVVEVDTSAQWQEPAIAGAFAAMR